MGNYLCNPCSSKEHTPLENKKTIPYSPYSTLILPLLKEKGPSDPASIQSIKAPDLTIEDFELLKQVGSGGSASIFLVRKRTSGKLYALKSLKKNDVSDKKQQEYTWNERMILQNNESPFIASLRYSFQNERFLFLVMDFLSGGDLFFHLKKETRFSEAKAAFYTAEILCGLDYLHEENYIYRDLKPENVLFNEKGHVQLVDFGLAKRLEGEKNTCRTLIGTPEYVAPEILLGKEYDKRVDYWGLGCVVYEMIIGKPPFLGSSVAETLKNIVEKEVDFGENEKFVSKDAREVILGLLEKKQEKRLNGEKLKKCGFFKGIDWEVIENGEIEPPFVPEIKGDIDLRYFEKIKEEFEVGAKVWELGEDDGKNLYDYYLNYSYRNRLESMVNEEGFKEF